MTCDPARGSAKKKSRSLSDHQSPLNMGMMLVDQAIRTTGGSGLSRFVAAEERVRIGRVVKMVDWPATPWPPKSPNSIPLPMGTFLSDRPRSFRTHYFPPLRFSLIDLMGSSDKFVRLCQALPSP